MDDLKKLKLLAKNIRILYVEDNEKLRINVQKLLQKFFDVVDVACDGQEGLDLFKKHNQTLVITDIKMPNMDGVSLSKEIKTIAPKTRIIILSAFDEKEVLYSLVELNIFKFLKKPINVTNFTDVLYEVVKEIKNEKVSEQLGVLIDDAFSNQSSIVLMLNVDEVVIVNNMFLEFFNVDSVKDFYKKYNDFGDVFLEYEGFFYGMIDQPWLKIVKKQKQKSYHVKIKNKDNKPHHFLLKYSPSSIDENHSVITLEDITDLNSSTQLDKEPLKSESSKKPDNSKIFELLKSVKDNSVKLDVHNYYKGLSITNSATIKDIKEDSITIKTAFLQSKAIKYESKTLLVSEIFPYPILCREVEVIGFEAEHVELKGLEFAKTSAILRKTIRLVPEVNHKVSLFIKDKEFNGDIKIEDISLDAVRLNLNALPAGLNGDDEITLDITLDMDDKPFNIKTKVSVLRQIELEYSFSVVFVFQHLKKTQLVKYITKRQMAIIREFKGS